MSYPLILTLLAPLTIAVGLLLLKNPGLTFGLFYGVVCIPLPVIDLFIRQKLSLRDACQVLGLQHFRRSLLPGIALGIVCFTAIVLFLAIGHEALIVPERLAAITPQWRMIERFPWMFGMVLIVVNPFVEELFWRGYLFSKWSQHVRPRFAIAITALGYASYHFFTTIRFFSTGTALFLTSMVFLAGVVWGTCRLVSDSAWCPIISHILADTAIVVVYVRYFLPLV